MDLASCWVAGAVSGTARAGGFLVSRTSGCAASSWAAVFSAASFCAARRSAASRRFFSSAMAAGASMAALAIALLLLVAEAHGFVALGSLDFAELREFRRLGVVGADGVFGAAGSFFAVGDGGHGDAGENIDRKSVG